MDNNLVHLIYASTAVVKFTTDEMMQLLLAARSKNHRLHISGMLLNIDNDFLQVLEGDAEQVSSLYTTIQKDPRHGNITQIIFEPIHARSFNEWTMGFSNLTPVELNSIEGCNDFFTQGTSFVNLGMGRAKKILNAFVKGHWRNSLT